MSDHHERYLETALDELHHGGPSEDLADRILARDAGPTLSLVKGGRRRRFWLLLQAASVLLVIGLTIFVVIQRDTNELPDGVIASAGSYELRDGRLEISEGWYALTAGAPTVSSNDTTIEQVSGRVLVRVGNVPDETELQAQHDWLRRNGMENAMSFKWIQAGGLAICVLAGTAVVDGTLVEAQKVEARNDEKAKDWAAVEKEIKADKQRIEDLQTQMEVASLRVENARQDVASAKKDGNAARIKEMITIQSQYEKEYKELETEYYRLSRDVNVREYELKVHKQEEVVAERTKALKQNPDDANAKKAALEAERELLSLKLALKTYREEARDAEAKAKSEEPITIDFVQKDIHTIMHYIALKSGLQIVVEGEIEGSFTVSYKDIAPRAAIKSICKANGLDMIEDGEVIIIKQGDPRFDFTFEGSLGDAIDTISSTTGVSVRAHKSLRDEHEVMVFVKQVSVRQVLDLLCDDLELSLVVIGDGYIIREQLADCTTQRLTDMADEHAAEAATLENQIQFAIVALEGAREEGNMAAVAESEKRLQAYRKAKADHEAELTALRGELGKRGDK